MARNLLGKVATPALPTPPTGPFRQYLDNLNNILRLFFNLLTTTVNRLIGDLGGRFLEMPNALFFSTVDQAIAATNTAQAISFENTYLNSGFTINGASTSQITATYSGVYNFQFSAQAFSASASVKNVYIWIRRDGVDIEYSATHLVLSGPSDSRALSWDFNIDVQAGSYIEMMWSSDDTNTKLGAQTATSPHPGEPSAVICVTFVSALPDVTPTPP